MKDRNCLIIDDEPDIRELLELTLGRMGLQTVSAENVSRAKELLQNTNFDMCLTDMKLPDGNGIEIVQYIQQHRFNLPVAVITAHGNMEMAITALKSGAFDFVSKPVDLQVLRNLVNTALKVSNSYPKADRRSRDILLGDSTAMQQTRSLIAKVARSQAPVYISGESGTGKELVARLIHSKGPRSEKPFVPVNCGAIPSELMESELFGYKKGSFTGATSDKDGLFQIANDGTLFLDEIADLPLHMQVKLLRAIQEKAVRPVGASKEVSIDVRILSATHKPLKQMVDEGKFRQDLFYRINVIELQVPPLRQRGDDIALLTDHVLQRFCTANGAAVPVVDQAARQALAKYQFPGNVRELENILERAFTLCENNTITVEDLQLPNIAEHISLSPAPEENGRNAHSHLEGGDVESGIDLENHLDSIEKEAITRALESTRYNKTAAAKLLGMSFRSLRYRLKKLGME